MTPDLNALRQLMDFHRSLFSRRDNNQFDPAAGDNQTGGDLNWAMQMMQGQNAPNQGAGDYFSDAPAYKPQPYVAPQGAPQGGFQAQVGFPQRGNALTRFMGGR